MLSSKKKKKKKKEYAQSNTAFEEAFQGERMLLSSKALHTVLYCQESTVEIVKLGIQSNVIYSQMLNPTQGLPGVGVGREGGNMLFLFLVISETAYHLVG